MQIPVLFCRHWMCQLKAPILAFTIFIWNFQNFTLHIFFCKRLGTIFHRALCFTVFCCAFYEKESKSVKMTFRDFSFSSMCVSRSSFNQKLPFRCAGEIVCPMTASLFQVIIYDCHRHYVTQRSTFSKFRKLISNKRHYLW